MHGHAEVFVPYLLARIPHVRDFGPCATMGVVNGDGVILGAVCFHGYQPEFSAIEVSTASDTPRWLTRPIIQQIFGYPFEQLGVERVAAVTPRKAHAARKFLRTFGFHMEGVARRGFGRDAAGRPVDAMAYSLLREEYFASRWARVRGPRQDLPLQAA